MNSRWGVGRFCLPLLLFLICTNITAVEFKLDHLLAQQAKLWQLSPPQFIKVINWNRLHWNSQAHRVLHYTAGDKELTLATLAIPELTIRFSANRLQRIEISLYNRGDIGPISEKLFQNKLQYISSYLNKLFNYRTSPAVKRRRLARQLIFESLWQNDFSTAKLRWSSSKTAHTKQPEFISLYLYASNIRHVSTQSSVDKKSLPQRVKHDRSGGTYLDIPMVDQGDKGYCVVAVLERVMKYYGSDIDQHLLAELAQSSAQSGTNLKNMTAALRDADVKLGIKFKTLYINPVSDNYRKFMMLLQYYNKLARKHHIPLLQRERFIERTGSRSYTYHPRQFVYQADPEIYSTVMQKYYRMGMKRFRRNIKKYITRGIPLLWSVNLGIFPEQGKKLPHGGHMRLIIGFNAKTKQIYYSDSWGEGHELKKISYRQAWAMTTATFIVMPRYQRPNLSLRHDKKSAI